MNSCNRKRQCQEGGGLPRRRNREEDKSPKSKELKDKARSTELSTERSAELSTERSTVRAQY